MVLFVNKIGIMIKFAQFLDSTPLTANHDCTRQRSTNILKSLSVKLTGKEMTSNEIKIET